MPLIDPSAPGAHAVRPRRRPKPKRREIYGPPAPTTRTPSITRTPFERPFTPQRHEATARVRSTRRSLAPLTLAAPPIVRVGPKHPAVHGRPLTRGEVNTFLSSTSKLTQAARGQIVHSIRTQVAGTHGRERQQRVTQVLDEIAHDPRLAGTRKAIRYYTALERGVARPQTVAELKAGPADRTAKVGVGPLNLATVNLTATGRALGGLVAGATPGIHGLDPRVQFLKTTGQDLGTLATGPFVGAYGASSAIIGDVAESLGSGKYTARRETEFAKGVIGSTVETLRHPEQHPILAPLTVLGGLSAAGRTGGALARGLGKKGAPGIRGKLEAHSHVVRPPVSMTNDAGQPMLVQRTYSKDLTRRAAQVAADRGREPLRDSSGRIVYRMDRGRKVPVLKSREGEQLKAQDKRGDFIAERTNRRTRDVRSEGVKATRVKGPKGRRAKDIVALVVQGAITGPKHFAEDLKTYRKMVADSIDAHEAGTNLFRHRGDLQTAQANLKLADRVLNDPKAMAQAPKVIEEGVRLGRDLHAGDLRNAAAQLGDRDALRRAGLIVPAVTHMGARHFTVEEHAALERQARKAEKAAQETLDQAKTPAARQAAQAAVNAAREHRIAVSGRHPEQTRAHEDAKTTLAAARKEASDAAKAEEKHTRRITMLVTRHRSERGREAHHGPVAVYHVAGKRFTLRQDAVDYLREVNRPAPLMDLEHVRSRGPAPPVRKGYVRLYRGQGVAAASHHMGDWVDAPEGQGESYGRWFTDEQARATGYAGQGGTEPVVDSGGFVSYVDVPAAVAKAAHHSTTKNGETFVLPSEWAVRAKELEPGSIERAQAARAERQRRSGDAEKIRARRRAAKRALGEPVTPIPRRRPRITIERVATTSGEAKRVGEITQARRLMGDIKARRRAADKAVAKAEQAVKKNPLPEAKAAVRYGEGNPAGRAAGSHLPTSEIEDFLRSRGRDPDTVAYLPHRHDVRGARAHYTQFRPGGRPVLDAGETRTGEAFRRGIAETSTQLIRDQGVRQRVQLVKAQQIDRLVADSGVAHPALAKHRAGQQLTPAEQRIVDKGGLFTPKEALEAADRLENDTGQRYTPMVSHRARLDPETRRVIREELQGPGAMDSLSSRLLNNRIVTPEKVAELDPGARNIVLVPSRLVERLEAHLKPAGRVEQLFQYVNRAFRYAVLPQFRWLTGNFVEPYLVRLPTVGSGLINIPGMAVDAIAYRKFMKAMDNGTPEMQAAAKEIRAQQTGSGTFIGGGEQGAVRRTLGEVLPERAAKAYGRFVSRLPVVDQMAQLTALGVHGLLAPVRGFFHVNLKLIEQPAQRVAFGHQFRKDVQAVTGSWAKSITLGRRAVEDAAKGLVDTPAQQRFMEAQHELLGKYSGFSPTVRAFVQTVTPFLPWMLNAMRFIYWTMPAHNTVKTAFLLQAQQSMAKDWEEIHKNTPPGNLRFAIPNGKGGWIDLARYTPAGALTGVVGGGDLQSLIGEFQPQIGGALRAAEGQDPFGRDLQLESGEDAGGGDKAKAIINALAESLIPYVSQIRRLREHGETAYSDSNVFYPKTKPGTSYGMSALERTLSPIRPTYLGGGTTTITPAEARALNAPAAGGSRTQQLLRRRARPASSGGGSSGGLTRTQRLLGHR